MGILFALYLYIIIHSGGQHEFISPVPESQAADQVQVDLRADNLRKFLSKYDSPLEEHAEYIVEISDRNGLDYRLIPSIAGTESTLCKHIPDASYNCWGWGIYGGQITRFDSYRQGIAIVGRGLGNPPYAGKSYQEFAEIYTARPDHWISAVSYFMEEIEG